MGYREAYNEWLTDPYFDRETTEELKAIADNEKEIEDRFYMDLEFGTAGLRGIIGAGSNRMNKYTVRKATQGLANYIRLQQGQDRGVVIAYDSRHMSPEFADEAALCLAANGIKAYVFDSLRPTPELSYSVRKLNCISGINITASHNPAEYNGYKVYWEDGAQITPPHDRGITEQVRAITNYSDCLTMTKDEAAQKGLYEIVGRELDEQYEAELVKQIIHKDAIDKTGSEIKIVYTPLHGTGNIPVQRMLKKLGFTKVYVVPEQEAPDGDFPTVCYPNPEADEAFDLAMKLAKKVDADIVLATDPDADRLGVRVKDKDGNYHALTGNMSGSLLAEYEISQKQALGILPEDGALIKTIVTTNLSDAVAENYGVSLIEVLTGFKYIGQKILEFEQNGTGSYLFGFEESYGCLIGTHARDKDAVMASVALCEATAYYRTIGWTLWDALTDMYDRYGYYMEDTRSITMKGMEGLSRIQEIMSEIRNDRPEKIGEYTVERIRDYSKDEILNPMTGEISATGLPRSNVIYYDLSDGAWVCIRPSGTEPKIKFYVGVCGTDPKDADMKVKALGEVMISRITT